MTFFEHALFFLFADGLYADKCFTPPGEATSSTASWDRAHTPEERECFYQQFAAVCDEIEICVVKCHPRDVEAECRAIEKHLHLVTFPHIWEKVNQNINGRAKLVPSCENLILGLTKRNLNSEHYWSGMPANPMDRHCIILGRCLSKFYKDGNDNVVNTAQTPMYLAQAMFKRYASQGKKIIINAMSGSGSDTLGIASLGHDVIAIESDKTMYESAVARLQVMSAKMDQFDESGTAQQYLASKVAEEGQGCFGVQAWIEYQEEVAEKKKQLAEAKVASQAARAERKRKGQPSPLCIFCKKVCKKDTTCFLCDEPLHEACGFTGDNEATSGELICKRGACITGSHVYVGGSGVPVESEFFLEPLE